MLQAQVAFSSLPCDRQHSTLARPVAAVSAAPQLSSPLHNAWNSCASVGAIAMMASPLLSLKRKKARTTRCGLNDPARGGRRVMSEVWFDLELSLPLGLELKDKPDGSGVYVASIRPGGSAMEHNEKELLQEKGRFDRPQHWVQELDTLRFVNGTRVPTVDDAVEAIQAAAADADSVTLGLARRWNRTVKVVFSDEGVMATADYQDTMANAAAKAEHLVKYQCNDGECGSCWRKDDRTGEIYVLCLDDVKVGLLPSKTAFNDDTGNVFWNEKAERERKDPKNSPYFDNTEPLVLRSCPEVYEEWKEANPLAAARAELTRNRLRGAFSGLAPGEESLGQEYLPVRPGATMFEE